MAPRFHGRRFRFASTIAFAAVTALLVIQVIAQIIGGHEIALASSLASLVACAAMYVFFVVPLARDRAYFAEQLEERRQYFSATFTHNPDAMALYDLNGAIRRVNRAARDMLGFPARFNGADWSIHIGESERETVRRHFLRTVGGEISEFETLFITKNGIHIPVLATLVPIRLGGVVRGVVGTARDLREIRATEEALVRSEARFRSMFDFHPDGVASISATRKITRVNTAFEELTGFRAEELIGQSLDMLAPAPDFLEHRGFAGRFDSTLAHTVTASLRRKNGSLIPTQVNAVPMMVNETSEGTYVIVRDVTRERELEYRERIQRERLKSVAQRASSDSTEADAQIQSILQYAMLSLEMQAANVAVLDATTMTMTHAVGSGYESGFALPVRQSYTRHLYGSNRVLAISDTAATQWIDDAARGAQHQWRAYIGTTVFVNGVPEAAVAFVSREPHRRAFDDADSDFVTLVAALIGAALARKKSEAQLSQIAYRDVLTTLPNRRYFLDQLAVALANARRHGGAVSLHYVDLDGFKPVNDRFGHAAGDEVLRIVAARFRALLRDSDVVARLGGDEFVVMHVGPSDDEAALRLGERIVESICDGMLIENTVIRLAASVGVARAPHDGTEATELLRRADAAMYAAKTSGGNCTVLYNETLEAGLQA